MNKQTNKINACITFSKLKREFNMNQAFSNFEMQLVLIHWLSGRSGEGGSN